ncbi:hypothetical protein AHiyo8_63330 [Arthrobacter sp. Hiyo8]|nr:hypothetical protein AHiyo8_63330 [Arthrobacter sp. Hiyo8]
MTSRIPAAEITGFYGALIKKFSAKMFGKVPESLGVMWHNQPFSRHPWASDRSCRSGTGVTSR